MRYCPIDDPKYFYNRDYVGRHWNKKFLRAIQSIINVTKGKVGCGREFFEKAFGRNLDEFYDLLYMPEAFIIYRFKYEDNLTADWRKMFLGLSDAEQEEAKKFISANRFAEKEIAQVESERIRELLKFYKLRR